jgi:hypothetical protein
LFLVVYLTTLSAAQTTASNDNMINELEGMWKEAVATYLLVLSRHLPEAAMEKHEVWLTCPGPRSGPETSQMRSNNAGHEVRQIDVTKGGVTYCSDRREVRVNNFLL